MAPLKLEDNIREQFENREIKPSEQAWKKLSDQLDQNQGSSKKGIGIWWAIAAGIAGLAILGSLLFNGDPAQQNNEIVVEEQPVETPATEEIIDANPVVEQNQQQEVIAVEEDSQKIQESPAKELIDKETPVSATTQTAVAKVPITEQSKESPKDILNTEIDNAVAKTEAVASDEIINGKSALEIKVAEVVDIIQQMENSEVAVSDEEIIDLLNQAQRELKINSQIDMETLKVDANALLLDVEFDIERSFRDKVFDALGEGYNKIRTAMANRNN